MNREEIYEEAERRSPVPLLRTLESKVDPAHTALIVIDVLNDFCADQGVIGREGFDLGPAQAAAGMLPGFASAARESGSLVVFVRNVYSSEPNRYLSDVWLEQAARRRGGSYTVESVCAPGSWGGEFYGDLEPEMADVIVSKHRFSSFHNTDLETVLRANRIRTVILTGVVTNVCVETAARDAFMRDFYVVVAEDGTAGYVPEDCAASLRTIDNFFGEVVPSQRIEQAWAAHRDRGDLAHRAGVT